MKSRLSILLLLALFFSIQLPGYAQPENTLSWNLVESPVRSRLDFIRMISPDKGYIAGKNLLEYNNGKWLIFNPQPPIIIIDAFFVLDEKNIWVSRSNRYNSSNFYHYNGKVWTELKSPLANQINHMFFGKDGSGVLAGDRELAWLNNGKWEFLPFPGNTSSANIYIWNGVIWIHAYSMKVFSFSQGKWVQHLQDKIINLIDFNNESHGFALSGSELWEFRNNTWKLHSSSPLLKNILKFFFLPDGKVWGCGADGLIAYYDKTKWIKIHSPVTEDLCNIEMISDNEGWITGVNGIILHYEPSSNAKAIKTRLGFQVDKPKSKYELLYP